MNGFKTQLAKLIYLGLNLALGLEAFGKFSQSLILPDNYIFILFMYESQKYLIPFD